MSEQETGSRLDNLYDLITGDEDARVCKDIPDSACTHQPRNFFAYLLANLFNKIADEVASAKLTLPWMLGALGAPAAFTGFLVPLREAGVLLPQMVVAAYIRAMPLRKPVWLLGAALSALSLFGMAAAALTLDGSAAGFAIVGLLAIFSLSRGLCSVSAKDVLCKTVSKSRRGRLMGYSSAIAGVAVLIVGAIISITDMNEAPLWLFAALLAGSGLIWLAAIAAFARIQEVPGATEGGGNALQAALQHLNSLRENPDFRRFVIARVLLLAVALAPPFYVLMAQAQVGGGLNGLGMLIVASGIAGSVSSPFWGWLGDRSSRRVMILAASGAGILGVGAFIAAQADLAIMHHELTFAVIFLLFTVMHSGVRLGRKVYLVDLATEKTRAGFVAVSNTVIGVAMLAGGLVGVLGDLYGARSVVLLLGLASLGAALYLRTLVEVE